MHTEVELQHQNKEELIQFITLLQTKNLEQENFFKEELKNKVSRIHQQDLYIKQLYEQIHLLKHHRFGCRTEKYIDDNPQGSLFDEATLPDNQQEIIEAEEEITVTSHKRKKRKKGRKALPKDLPRQQIVYELPESERVCACGCQLVHIGNECTEQLDIIPAKLYVIEHIQKKYACKHCKETIKTAKKTAQPIPKSIAAPGLLANVLTQKYQFHLPLYRQEQQLKAIGADIPRATLSHWVIQCGKLLQPLVNLLQDEILNYDVAYSDESTVQVLKENGKTAESTSYMWVFGGGPPKRFGYVYQYFPNRKHDIAVDYFIDFKGYLHCDGYQAYDKLAEKNTQAIQVGCWYHVRRKFVEAAKVSKKPGLANWYIKQIQRLSKIEKFVAENLHKAEEIKNYRHTHAKGVIEKIQEKLKEQINQVPPQSTLGKAIAYALNQWPKLLVYLTDGRLEISNNRIERAIRPFALGRKNWLFANSVQGAKAAANIYSLIETCKAHQVNPYDWLRDTLTKIPVCEKLEQFEALLPFNFKHQKINPCQAGA